MVFRRSEASTMLVLGQEPDDDYGHYVEEPNAHHEHREVVQPIVNELYSVIEILLRGQCLVHTVHPLLQMGDSVFECTLIGHAMLS